MRRDACCRDYSSPPGLDAIATSSSCLSYFPPMTTDERNKVLQIAPVTEMGRSIEHTCYRNHNTCYRSTNSAGVLTRETTLRDKTHRSARRSARDCSTCRWKGASVTFYPHYRNQERGGEEFKASRLNLASVFFFTKSLRANFISWLRIANKSDISLCLSQVDSVIYFWTFNMSLKKMMLYQ